MSRSQHQFRPGPLEMFETRIVPTVTSLGPIGFTPFTPPGHVLTDPPLNQLGAVTAPYPTANGDTIKIELTNNTGTYHSVTVAIYTAPGAGGQNGSSGNSQAQRLAYSKEVCLPPGTTCVYLNIQELLDRDKLDLHGQNAFQCDVFDYPDGFAPDKIDVDQLDQDGSLVTGELFTYDRPPAGKGNH